MKSAAIDFETFYSSAEKYSLRGMSPHAYVHDPRFDAYLVSVHGDGVHYVGRPESFDWNLLSGFDVVAHNMAFDGLVLRRLIELGKVPDFRRREFCTADLAAFLLVPRNLAGAVEQLYGTKLSKAVRTNMDGKTLADAVREGGYNDLVAYADGDAVWCHRIWTDHAAEWPEWEREASRLNREACWRGVRIDRKAVEEGLAVLEGVNQAALDALPWHGEYVKGKEVKAGSVAALSRYLRSHNVQPPSSYRKDGPEMVKLFKDVKAGKQTLPGLPDWLDRDTRARLEESADAALPDGVRRVAGKEKFEHDRVITEPEDVLEVLEARVDVASLGSHIARLQNMLDTADGSDTLRFSLKYYGAHTGRNSSGDSDGNKKAAGSVSVFNPLNLPKEPVCGVNMRNLLLPRDGRKFCIFDFGQIEARVILWLARHQAMLDRIGESSGNLYVAYGLLIGKVKWEDVGTPQGLEKFKKTYVYAALKATILARGFGMGDDTFRANVEKQSKGKLVFTAEEAEALGKEWRAANRPVCDFWGRLESDYAKSAMAQRSCHTFVLPSGRKKHYFSPVRRLVARKVVNKETGEAENVMRMTLLGCTTKGGHQEHFWGGDLAQNLTQAVARDIMTQGAVEVCHKHPSWLWDWSVYDEVIFEVPDEEVEEALVEIPRLLCHGEAATTWAAGLPLSVDGGAFDKYLKM